MARADDTRTVARRIGLTATNRAAFYEIGPRLPGFLSHDFAAAPLSGVFAHDAVCHQMIGSKACEKSAAAETCGCSVSGFAQTRERMGDG